MARHRIFWQVYISFLLIVVLSVVAVAWYASESQRRMYLSETASDLEARARLLEPQIAQLLFAGDAAGIDHLCKVLGMNSGTRLTVVLPSGVVIGDSDGDPQAMEDHGDRPEMAEALATGHGTSVRFSNTLQQTLMYVAVKSTHGGETVGVVRTAIPVTSIDQVLYSTRLKMATGGLIVALIAAVVALFVSRRISRPLEELKEGAERFASGDLTTRLPVPESEEIGALAEAMNDMAAQLHRRIGAITQQRNEQEAILGSMAEGILAVDTDERLMNLNRVAVNLLDLDIDTAMGLTLQETVRNTELQRIVGATLETREPIDAEIVISGEEDRIVKVSATSLRDAEGNDIGAVLVLNDVTRIRRLESMRREFVANVSHELKTPITSILGSVETLLDTDLRTQEDTREFLSIILRQADRLYKIVEDLLTLSRIERESEEREIELERWRLKKILQSSIQTCETGAAAKQVQIDLVCDDDLEVTANALLLEQAVVNLLDNAVKYSDEGKIIEVHADIKDDSVRIIVRDYGCGIEKRHLPRIFERFYRADKARSRKLGGTGLGLAIVKHIVLAHGGQVNVQSVPGKGTTFSISLPAG
jgi:two-component system phosphate regulon sensor histidine kinase PhoR